MAILEMCWLCARDCGVACARVAEMAGRAIPIAAALIAVAACRPAPEGDGNGMSRANPVIDAATAAPADSEVDINASLALDQLNGLESHSPPPRGGGALPPAEEPLRFVGRWSAETRLCASAVWRFTPDSLASPAGARCRFDRVHKVPGGYDIAARCTAEGPERADTIRLRFAESARAMLFESESIADAGLVYCGG